MKSVQAEKTIEPSVAVYYPPTPKKDVHPGSYTAESPAVRYSVQQNFRAAMPYEHQRIPQYPQSPTQPPPPAQLPHNPYEALEKHPTDFRPLPPPVSVYPGESLGGF